MSKKGLFSRDDETAASKDQPEQRDETTNDPNLQTKQTAPDAPQPTGSLPRDLNYETADAAGLVNPHNEAAAQRPGTVPLDQGDRVQGLPLSELDKRSHEDRQHLLHAWARDVQLGGPRSADWETFYRILGKDKDSPVFVPRTADEAPPKADEKPTKDGGDPSRQR